MRRFSFRLEAVRSFREHAETVAEEALVDELLERAEHALLGEIALAAHMRSLLPAA